MEATHLEKILLETAFCCMASDGHIDTREVNMIENLCSKSNFFKDLELHHEVNKLVQKINTDGKHFIGRYLQELNSANLSETEELILIDFALRTINADEILEYSEIKFFKNIRHRLKVSDNRILIAHPDIADFLEEDIKNDSYLESITSHFLDIVELPQFDVIDLTQNDLK